MSNTTQAHTNFGFLMEHSPRQAMVIPIAPVKGQKAICTELETLMSRVDAISEFSDNSSDRLVTLNQAILAKAFRGELVPQDPNDEPSSAPLNRLRQGGQARDRIAIASTP